MTRLVIKRVKTLAKRQGYKSLKFFNQKHEEMTLTNADLLKGVGGPHNKNLLEEDEEYVNLPPIDDGIGPDSESDEELDVDNGVDAKELAELLDDTVDISKENDSIPEEDPQEDDNDSANGSDDGPDNWLPDQVSVEDDIPSLTSKPEPHRSSTRATREPERYNPESGTSYHQEVCHNIVCQTEKPEKKLEYKEHESKFVASMITYLKETCNEQQFNLKKGLKEFKVEDKITSKE